uniref:Uncharacterized protein n=1 Tax=Anguilla anguilla TaxID=7936 RepID=A0A0E9TDT9_ANGAN
MKHHALISCILLKKNTADSLFMTVALFKSMN